MIHPESESKSMGILEFQEKAIKEDWNVLVPKGKIGGKEFSIVPI